MALRTEAVRTPCRAAEARAFAAFRLRYREFDETRHLDELRATEYRRLDDGGHVYLDYTGAGLYAASQLTSHLALLQRNVLGNPHSVNPASSAATEFVERARAAVLRFFNASPAEYAVVFTPNATGAIKLVGEAYPFGPTRRLVLTSDNHNSMNGLREFARAAGAATTYVPSATPSLRVDGARLARALAGGGGLLAYPAQSNFSGVQHPLEWIADAQAADWDVLLDAAAYVPTNRLDLGTWHPDFVPVSFYKLLGYPTGVGCLLVRKRALRRLRRPWFAGGTIVAASAAGDWSIPAEDHSALEDGTVDFLSLAAVEQGLAYVAAVGIDSVHTRVQCLTAWLLDELAVLRHTNGRRLVQLYGPLTTDRRGGTVAFNFLHPDGRVVDERIVDRIAAAHRVSLRTGCFCNPGAAEIAFGLRPSDLVRAGAEPLLTYDDYLDAVGLETGGAVRVSVGVATSFGDVWRFMRFAEAFRDRPFAAEAFAPRLRC